MGDIGSLVASLGGDLSDLKRSVNSAERLLKSYEKTTGNTIKKTNTHWAGAGKALKNVETGLNSFASSFKTLSLVGVASLTAITYASVQLGKSFTVTASRMEDLQTSLETITKGQGEEWFQVLNEWALKMPVNTEKAVAAFTNMRAMGMKPTIKDMTVLVDTMSALGGQADTLSGIARALGQIQTKGKVQAEELLQLAERGIPAYEILSEKLGVVGSDFDNLTKAGVTSAQAINALMEGMAERFGGQSEKMMKQWSGLTESIKSYYKEFQRLVMASGPLQAMKDGLLEIVTIAERLQQSGQLAEYAKQTGVVFLNVISKIVDAVGFIPPAFFAVKEAIGEVTAFLVTMGQAAVDVAMVTVAVLRPTIAIKAMTKGFATALPNMFKFREELGEIAVGLLEGANAAEQSGIKFAGYQQRLQALAGTLRGYATDIVTVNSSLGMDIVKNYDNILNKVEETKEEEVKLEEEKADDITDIWEDLVKNHTDASNNMLQVTEQRVNKEVQLEKDKAFKLNSIFDRESSDSFRLMIDNTKPTRPQFNYMTLKWEQVQNPNYSPAISEKEEITTDLISNSNTYLSNIQSTQEDLLREYESQTDILRDAFGTVSGLLDEMTMGDLAVVADPQLMGLEYERLLSQVKSATVEGLPEAAKAFAQFVPNYLRFLESSSADFGNIFESLKKDVSLLELSLGVDVFQRQMEILPESIKLSDFITFDWTDLQNDINTGKLAEANTKVLELMASLQTDLPAAVLEATGGKGIEGFNTSLVSTLFPLENASDNTETVTSNVADNLIAMGDMFTALAAGLAGTTIPSITESINAIAKAAQGDPLQQAYLQEWIKEAGQWMLYTPSGRLVRKGPMTYDLINGEVVPNNYVPAPVYVPYAKKGGITDGVTIAGEAGRELIIPLYEPEQSNLLKKMGVSSGEEAPQIISVQIDGREIVRALANQSKSNSEFVKTFGRRIA